MTLRGRQAARPQLIDRPARLPRQCQCAAWSTSSASLEWPSTVQAGASAAVMRTPRRRSPHSVECRRGRAPARVRGGGRGRVAVSVRQGHPAADSRPSVGQGVDRRAADPADGEVALPVPDQGTALDRDAALTEQPSRSEGPWRTRRGAARALAERPAGLLIDVLSRSPFRRGAAPSGSSRGTDRSRPLGMSLPQLRGDLRRAPLVLELVLHDPPQLGLATRQRPSWPPRLAPGRGRETNHRRSCPGRAAAGCGAAPG